MNPFFLNDNESNLCFYFYQERSIVASCLVILRSLDMLLWCLGSLSEASVPKRSIHSQKAACLVIDWLFCFRHHNYNVFRLSDDKS